MSTGRATWSMALLSPLACVGPAFAGTSAPFDIGGLVQAVLLYLGGLIVLLIAAASGRRGFGVVAFLWFICPIIGIAIASILASRAAEAQREQEAAANRVKMTRIYETASKVCESSRLISASRVRIRPNDPIGNRILSIGRDALFPSYSNEHDTGAIVEFLNKNLGECKKSGVLFLEGVRAPTINRLELWRYPVCEPSKAAERVERGVSRYQLVFGAETSTSRGSQDGIVWKVQFASLQIKDRETREVIAEDTIALIDGETGRGSCPSGAEQAARLILSTFRLE